MSSALDAFRAQKEAADRIHARLVETSALLRNIKEETHALAHNEALRRLLQDEQTWLSRAEEFLKTVRYHREWEVKRFWPAVWRRWAVATAFTVLTAVAAGAGYAWVARPYESELVSLRLQVESLNAVAQRVLKMTPSERGQFDALMKSSTDPKR
jgi:DNA-binding transcriptional LysR family regulator